MAAKAPHLSVKLPSLPEGGKQMVAQADALAEVRRQVGGAGGKSTLGYHIGSGPNSFASVPNSARLETAFDEVLESLTTEMDRAGAAMNWIAEALNKSAENYEQADQAAANVYRDLKLQKAKGKT